MELNKQKIIYISSFIAGGVFIHIRIIKPDHEKLTVLVDVLSP